MIEPELPAATEEILATIAREVPEYARPLEGAFGSGIRTGVSEALRQFVALIRDPDAGREPGRDVYVALGRGSCRQGRTLDSLQSAYRIGARVAWRRISAAARRHRVDPDQLAVLAEAIFAYIDELSADSVEGYAQAQREQEGERQRRRRELLALLLRDPPAEEPELRAAAQAAGWRLPRSAAPLAVAEADLARVARRLSADALVGSLERGRLRPGRGRARARALSCAGRPSRSPQRSARPSLARELGSSWALAKAALRAAEAGAIDGTSPLAAEEHLAELLIFESGGLAERLAESRLAPLAELTPAARARMEETALAFVQHGGNAAAMARALHLHPQTVRYRLDAPARAPRRSAGRSRRPLRARARAQVARLGQLRQLEADDRAAVRRVRGARSAVVLLGDPLDDRQPEARAGLAARVVGAPEAVEDPVEVAVREARPVVADGRPGPRRTSTSTRLPGGLHLVALSSMFEIARPTRCGSTWTREGSSRWSKPIPRARRSARSIASRVSSSRATSWRAIASWPGARASSTTSPTRSVISSSSSVDVRDQPPPLLRIEAVASPERLDVGPQGGERGAQLVRGVGDQPPLRRLGALERGHHLVEAGGQAAELVVAADLDPVGEVVGPRHLLGRVRDLTRGRERRPGDDRAERGRQRDAAGADRGQDDDQGVEGVVGVLERAGHLDRRPVGQRARSGPAGRVSPARTSSNLACPPFAASSRSAPETGIWMGGAGRR